MPNFNIQDIQTLFQLAILFVILLPVVYYDLVHHKIPNFITISSIISGLVIVILFWNKDIFINHILGFLTGFGVFYIFYLLKWVGAGDVKLMSGVGLVMGTPFIFYVLFYTFLIGGIIGIIFLVISLIRKQNLRKVRIPYGTAIVLGCYVAVWNQYISRI